MTITLWTPILACLSGAAVGLVVLVGVALTTYTTNYNLEFLIGGRHWVFYRGVGVGYTEVKDGQVVTASFRRYQ